METVQVGAPEALAVIQKPLPKPRKYESFVMTGDMMINVDNRTSTSIIRPQMSAVNFPSMSRKPMRSRIPVTYSQPAGIRLLENIDPPNPNYSPVKEFSSTPVKVPQSPEKEIEDRKEMEEEHVVPQVVQHLEQQPEEEDEKGHQSPTPSDPKLSESASFSERSESGSINEVDMPKPNDSKSSPPETSNQDPEELADDFYYIRGCTSQDVADKINENTPFSQLVLTKYLDHFQFTNIRLDAALREFLARVELRGESSQRERILQSFSNRYHECNPSLFGSPDEVHLLTCALLLLNSDLHGPNISKKMSRREFVNNIGQTGCIFKPNFLKDLYASIKDAPIVVSSAEIKKEKVSTNTLPVCNQGDPSTQVEYKSGFLRVKMVCDQLGKEVPKGRRSWKEYYAQIRGLVLYFSKDEGNKQVSRYETFRNSIQLHHAFATPDNEYKKRPHVIRLTTAVYGEILLQASDTTEMQDWCEKINYVAAAFSSPALAGALSSANSMPVFPMLPKTPTTIPISQQLRNHERALEDARRRYDASMATFPMKSTSAGARTFLEGHRKCIIEVSRYTEYARLLGQQVEVVDGDRSSYDEAILM